MLNKSKQFAEEKHKNQKYGEYPYTKHLEDVVRVLESFDIKNPSILCSGWLHDTIEDTPTSYDEVAEQFTKEIADIVFAVTNEPGKNRKERNSKTYPKIKKCLKAACVKLADRIANVNESIANNPNLLAMYKKEYPSFKEGIKRTDNNALVTAMWEHLDNLLK